MAQVSELAPFFFLALQSGCRCLCLTPKTTNNNNPFVLLSASPSLAVKRPAPPAKFVREQFHSWQVVPCRIFAQENCPQVRRATAKHKQRKIQKENAPKAQKRGGFFRLHRKKNIYPQYFRDHPPLSIGEASAKIKELTRISQ